MEGVSACEPIVELSVTVANVITLPLVRMQLQLLLKARQEIEMVRQRRHRLIWKDKQKLNSATGKEET